MVNITSNLGSGLTNKLEINTSCSSLTFERNQPEKASREQFRAAVFLNSSKSAFSEAFDATTERCLLFDFIIYIGFI